MTSGHQSTSPGARDGIIRAYKEHQDLLIFALTGRTGSGCTTAANLLSGVYDHELALNFGPTAPELRKHKIVTNFAEKNWTPFTKVTVSSLLIALLADAMERDEELKVPTVYDQALDTVKPLLNEFIRENSTFLRLLSLPGVDFLAAMESQAEYAVRVITHELPVLLSRFKDLLGDSYSSFMQTVGDNVRSSGNPCVPTPNPNNLFRLPQAIVRSIECIRENDKVKNNPTRIVVDAIRNPLELVYLRDRYSSLYAIAVTANEDDRRDRLHAAGLSQALIDELDKREYPEKHDPLSTYQTLITQDIQSCLQKADIFVSNLGAHAATKSRRRASNAHLYSQLLRYYALALHPGLVTPTRDERCMQVALVAKLNSGCISRQVGAAVTDDNFVVRAIGWNDVPRGQVPCALRNVDELSIARDQVAYSEYERTNDTLRTHIFEIHEKRQKLASVGLPCSYCFKDAANKSVFAQGRLAVKGTNQVHTRSLHAEENAFLQLTSGAGPSIRGGRLFTTASPCELCSKKAYQLGIADIVYIDPYPGISIPQVLMTGEEDARPRLRLFHGAVGKAYHRLYEAMLPIKDEIAARLQ